MIPISISKRNPDVPFKATESPGSGLTYSPRTKDERAWPITNQDNGDNRPLFFPSNPDRVGSPEPASLSDPYEGRLLDNSAGEQRIQQIAEWLRLFVRSGQVVELRAINVCSLNHRRPHTESGFFDYHHLDAMAKAAYDLTFDAEGVYFTLNPLNPDLLARRCNRVAIAGDDTARDVDVMRRARLLIDMDPKRIAGVSASEEEKALAQVKIREVRDYLRELRWPEPVFADSGNGYHLLYDIDLPVEDGQLVKRVLTALATRFDTDVVKIDRSVFNPSRIVKLYGTQARKGDDVPQRPHRWAAVLEVPGERTWVPTELLEAVAREVPAERVEKAAVTQVLGMQPTSHESARARARAYLNKIPPAISGEGGHNRTFTTANVLVRGFGLPVEEALPLFQEWNQKCQPPWKEAELRHKLEDAEKQEGPRGYLLGQGTSTKATVASSFQADFLDSASFDALEIRQEWLIHKILVARQAAVVGGPKKVLKTSLMVDLAVSLGSANPFLRVFNVPQRVNVLVLSGESGQAAIQSTARRVCKAKGVALSECSIHWGFRLPWLSNEGDLSALRKGIVENGIEVVIIDPLYLCLLTGNAGLQAGNLYQMGPLLLAVAQACLDAGATPILVHHTTKMSQSMKGNSNEPLDLEDLAFAGVAEFARQWLIVSRREKYDPEVGDHKLWLNVGGSAGHSGLYGLDVKEGVLNERFGGREWQVTIQTAANVRAASAVARRQQKEADRKVRDDEDQAKVLEVLQKHPDGETGKQIGIEAGIGNRAVGVLFELLREQRVVRTTIQKACGRNKAMRFDAWRLIHNIERELMTPEQLDMVRKGTPIEEVLGVKKPGEPKMAVAEED